jgi:hypothetical protein
MLIDSIDRVQGQFIFNLLFSHISNTEITVGIYVKRYIVTYLAIGLIKIVQRQKMWVHNICYNAKFTSLPFNKAFTGRNPLKKVSFFIELLFNIIKRIQKQ